MKLGIYVIYPCEIDQKSSALLRIFEAGLRGERGRRGTWCTCMCTKHPTLCPELPSDRHFEQKAKRQKGRKAESQKGRKVSKVVFLKVPNAYKTSKIKPPPTSPCVSLPLPVRTL